MPKIVFKNIFPYLYDLIGIRPTNAWLNWQIMKSLSHETFTHVIVDSPESFLPGPSCPRDFEVSIHPWNSPPQLRDPLHHPRDQHQPEEGRHGGGQRGRAAHGRQVLQQP